jgi:putative FmdB family regulatory protein
MPAYEYYCERCASRFELIRSMSRAAEPADCPQCEAPAKRAISVFAAFTVRDGGESAPISGTAGCACGGVGCACGGG